MPLRKAFVLCLLLAGSASAQSPEPAPVVPAPETFLDPGASALFERARAARHRTDDAILSYTAIVRSRFGAGMRMPLKDRTLLREETAARVRWSRDAATVVQVLAQRTQHPGGVEASRTASGMGIDQLFDPSRDRLYFGLRRTREADQPRSGDEDYWIEHPLGDRAPQMYRYQSADTLTIRLQDGRLVQAIELVVIPRAADPHAVRGALWIDAASGALVRAVFRLARRVDILSDIAVFDDEERCSYRVGEEGERQSCRTAADMVPGFLKPVEFDISLMTVEYSLWELEHWLPRTMRMEGAARAGVIVFPAAFDISYDMEALVLEGESVTGEDAAADATAAAWASAGENRRFTRKQNGRPFIVIAPQDSMKLLQSELLPPPVWSDAPGFITEAELGAMVDRLESVAESQAHGQPVRFGWGYGEPDMLRYNRVEALSVGARVTLPLPQAELGAVARLGIGDLHPNIELSALRASARRTLELRAYHALATVDVSQNAFGVSNSAAALFLGRDEGEYYRATGAAMSWAPPALQRRTWDVTAYAEHQDEVARGTHIALPRVWRDSVFRTNITADEAMQYGMAVGVRPWWGTDPRRAQFGIDLQLHGETGDFEHARGRLTLRAAAPLLRGVRVGAEAGAGTSLGRVPVQRRFFLGGASTLRGYDAGTVSGTSMARGRLELARSYPSASIALFTDWGWAGDRTDIRSANQRLAAGIGASLLDGLVRLDLARALRAPTGWRLDLHVDAVL